MNDGREVLARVLVDTVIAACAADSAMQGDAIKLRDAILAAVEGLEAGAILAGVGYAVSTIARHLAAQDPTKHDRETFVLAFAKLSWASAQSIDPNRAN